MGQNKTTKFKDGKGREWDLALAVATIKRVRALANVNLYDAIRGDLLHQLIADPVLLCDTLFAIVKPEADRQSVYDEDFGGALAGDSIWQASEALMNALVSFCPSPGERANLGRILEKIEVAMREAEQIQAKRIEEFDPAREVHKLAETSSGLSGSAPASSA